MTFSQRLQLRILPQTLAVCRLNPAAALPAWAAQGPFYAITRTGEELSIVCGQENAPADVQSSGGWRALKVQGPLDFSLTGILAGLAGVLAEAGISIFALSTFDTDYLLVRGDSLNAAVLALTEAGYEFIEA